MLFMDNLNKDNVFYLTVWFQTSRSFKVLNQYAKPWLPLWNLEKETEVLHCKVTFTLFVLLIVGSKTLWLPVVRN